MIKDFKKGDIWISAVLYMALGIIILTLILAAGIPVVNKIKDRNTILQTKELMFDLDNVIRDVVNQGPGAQKSIKLEIGRGKFSIQNNTINWELESKALIAEPGIKINEGNLIMMTESTNVKDQYNTKLMLNYTNSVDINLVGLSNVFSGNYNLLILNIGGTNLPTVEITEI